MSNSITYKSLINSVSSNKIGRDEDSLNVFEWILEDHYENKIKQNRVLFNKRPDLYYISNEQILFELDRMLNHFIEIEEYEKCSKILSTTKEIKKMIATNILL